MYPDSSGNPPGATTRVRLLRIVTVVIAWGAGMMAGGSVGYHLAATRAVVPEFARKPYEPFRRAEVIAIAQREWRLFGAPIHDEPESSNTPDPTHKAERQPGLWERVGEYFWFGLYPDMPLRRATGKHDETGRVFPAREDDEYAWSAAFISYVMRMAGAGDRFPYSARHADYINAARQASLGRIRGLVVWAERPDVYAPQPGDLICYNRMTKPLRFEDLPAGNFASHCDIVVESAGSALTVIGGNVQDAVALKHVPLTADGKLVGADGRPVDDRYAWFVVLSVIYDF